MRLPLLRYRGRNNYFGPRPPFLKKLNFTFTAPYFEQPYPAPQLRTPKKTCCPATELTQENSDRRKAEEALRASEQRLQDIIDNTSAVISVKDLELDYLLVNREFERRHNVRRNEIRGKDDFDILPYEVAEKVRANDVQVIEAGAPIQFEEVVPSEQGNRCNELSGVVIEQAML
jgi:PAS domain S-box-containing protein